MSEYPILISLKDAAIAKIEDNPKLKMDTVFLLRRDINHIQTLSELIRFISSNKLEIDTTNLQEDFDVEQRAAAKPSDLLSTGRQQSRLLESQMKRSWMPSEIYLGKFRF